MEKKRWLILVSLLVVGLTLAACGGGPVPEVEDDGTQARIAELESQLADAQAGGAGEDEIAALQEELEGLQGELSVAEAAKCTYNVYRLGWIMDFADPVNIVNEVFAPTSDNNYTFWGQAYPDQAAEFESLVDQALVTTDQASRVAIWQDAENILLDTTMVFPLNHYDYYGLMNTDVDYFFPPFGAPKISLWSIEGGRTTLYYPIAQPVPTLDIQDSTDTTSSLVLYQLIDAPYRFNEEGGIEPLAATGFDVSDDGKTYTIHLREGAVWSDGEPVTAQQYVDGIARLLSPDLANDYAFLMFIVEGAEAYNAGELDALESVQAVDDNTLEVTLTEPLAYFDSILAFSTMHPVRLDVLEEFGDDWTQPGNFVSNGAYLLTDHRPGEVVVLEKNPLYWNADNVTIEQIELSVIDEPATALAAFEAGETDSTIMPQQPADDLPRLIDTPEFTITPRPGTFYFGFNTVNGPTADLDFRRALSTSVDRRALLDEVLETRWRREAYGVIPPEILGFQGDTIGYEYDLDAAQGYLQAYMDRNNIEDPSEIALELWYNRGGQTPAAVEAVEAQWEENLGIDVRAVQMEFGVYLDTLEECNVLGGGGF
jgi:oligopeptide transport system substrate-binding protein